MSVIRSFNQYFISVLISLVLSVAHAAVPDNVDYQGYLADSSGSPVSGTVSVTFSLYNVDTGGVALWSDTQSVTPDNGLFNVKLGSVGNPFPAGLFDAPIYIGINVAGDGEMLPRVAMSSAGFAHKANDADSLAGTAAINYVTNSVLESHSSDDNVHHVKTTTFTELTGQASDAQIPATISRSSDLSSHTAKASVHHTRYSNTEAVSAMGAQADTNPLRHSKRTDGQVMAAVLGLDGAGSSLDADLVDGMQASEIIDAASDEVRTPISSLPFTISAPGSYYLTGNLDGSSGGIDITVDNVSLDLMGFTINGGGSVADYGVEIAGIQNVAIMNGSITGFGNAGIYAISTSSSIKVVDVQATNNGSLGTSTTHSGIAALGRGSYVEKCSAAGNGGPGIITGTSAVIKNNVAYGNTGYYGILGNNSSLIKDNVVEAHNVSTTAFTVAINGYGGSTVVNNIVRNNTVNTGIYVSSAGLIQENSVAQNTVVNGIYAPFGTNIVKNTVRANTAAYGIYLGGGSNATDNNVSVNSRWGIYGLGYNQITGNSVIGNNSSSTVDQGGIRAFADSQVKNNLVSGNGRNNIVVASSRIVVEENTVTLSTNGILFNISGSFYANNRASGNTTNYNFGATTQTNGGGNYSF